MNGKVFKRLIATILTGGVLISSTGAYTVMSYASAPGQITNYNSSDASTSVSNDENTNDYTTESTTSAAIEETSSETRTTTAPVPTEPATEKTTHTEDISEEIHTQPRPDSNKASAVTWVGVQGASATDEAGSEANPYAVSDLAHLLAMSSLINDTGNGLKYFQLTANIDLSAVTMTDIVESGRSGLVNTIISVDPTAESDNVFFVLDGDNHTLSGLNVTDSSRNSVAIVGYLNSKSVLKNVNFNNITITSNYSSAVAVGVVLKNNGTISDCKFTNITVSSNSTNTDEYFNPVSGSAFKVYAGVSGVVVDNAGIISAQNVIASIMPFNNITVTATGTRTYLGGIAAQNRGYINYIRCGNVRISATADNKYVGGIAGANLTTSTSNSYGIFNSSVSIAKITGGHYAGGVTGVNKGRIMYTTVTGTVKSSALPSADNCNFQMTGGNIYGGIAAENTGIIDKCSALDLGAYFATSASGGIYGGIAGTNTYLIQNCVSTGATANNDTSVARSVGGVVGQGSSEAKFVVKNCYTLVKILKTPTVLGSVVGTNGDYKKVTNCYYSSVVSGRPAPTSYSGTGAEYGDLQYSIPYVAISLSGSKTLNYTDFTFSGWGTGTTITVPGGVGSFREDANETKVCNVNASSENLVLSAASSATGSQTIYYNATIKLPSGVGNTTDALTLTAQPLTLRTIQKAGSWVGQGTYENPYEITAAQASLIAKVPYGHYKFTGNFELTQTIWPSAITFWGSVDFNNITITGRSAYYRLFSGIYGSRDNTMAQNDASNHKSSVASDTASNTKYGVVKNLKYTLAADITDGSAILGNVCNATVFNADISGSMYFNATSSNVGVVFNGVYGNSYLYGCYSNVKVNTNVNTVGGLIGYIHAECAIIDNCGSQAIVNISQNGIAYCGGFVGEIVALDGGYIQNCFASGGVRPTSAVIKPSAENYLFAGKSVPEANIYNCYYSPSEYYISNLGAAKGIADGAFTGSLSLWSFASRINILATSGIINANTIENMDRFDLPTNVSGTITTLSVDFDGANGYSSNNIYMTGAITVSVQIVPGADENATVYLKHATTGLVAMCTIMASNDLEIDPEGFYLIQKPTDLYIITSQQAELVDGEKKKYIGADYKFKLVADIDMTGFEIRPWGESSGFPFQGTLTADTNADGSPKYSIKGLTIASNSGTRGLFGFVSGASVSNIILDSCTTRGGTYVGSLIGQVLTSATVNNCQAKDCTVTAVNSAGGLIGGIYTGNGANLTTIVNCSVDGTSVTSTADVNSPVYTGGIIGRIGSVSMENETKYAAISGCTVTGSTITANGYGVGGIVGYASNNSNTISSSTVRTTTLTSKNKTNTQASLGGIAGSYGGNITSCTLENSTVTGSYAAGIVTRLINMSAESKIENCSVVHSVITSEDDVAAGILSYIGGYGTTNPIGSKVITGCSVDADTQITAKVAAGIFGSAQNFSGYSFTIENCKSFATVTSTGGKGSRIEGAAAIAGRFTTGLNTDNISIKNCIAGGKINGSSSLGGVVALLLSAKHQGDAPLISNCYITAATSQATLRSIKGLVVATVGDANQTNFAKIASYAVFSSYGTTVSPYGNAVDTNKVSYYDMNLGADQQSGIKVSAATNPDFVLSGDNTNFVTVSPSNPGESKSIRFKVDTASLPSDVGGVLFDFNTTNRWQSANPGKVGVGTTNTKLYVLINTYEFKARTKIYATFEASLLGTTVAFNVNFTIAVAGIHKYDGQGTVQSPYEIYDLEDLQEIKTHYDDADDPNHENYYSAHYVLMNNIDCSELAASNESFLPIGSADSPFKGSISSVGSNVFSISNLQVLATSENISAAVNPSDNYGLFGYTDGASIANINFENITFQGGNFNGTVVGKAVNTEIDGITVSGLTTEESAYCGGIVGMAGNNVVISNVSVTGDADNSIILSSQSTSGGIVGWGASAEGSSIANAHIQYANIEATGVSGAIYAGGIAASYSGRITDATVDNCNVQAVLVGGAVAAGSTNNGNYNYGLSLENIYVNGCTILSGVSGTGSIAGGILGTSFESYVYTFNNCNVDANTSVTANYVAGGIVGRVLNNGTRYASSFEIQNSKSLANVTQTVTGVSETFGDARKSAGAGGIIGLIGQSAYLGDSQTYEAMIRVYDSTAGGVLSGSINVGGIIGQIASIQTRVDQVTESLVDNCIIITSFAQQYNANLRFGVVVGCIEGNVNSSETTPYPDSPNYPVLPFNNIYYSSYMSSSFNLYGKTLISSYQNVNFGEKVYDLNQVRFVFQTQEGGTTELPVGFVGYNKANQTGETLNINNDTFVFSSAFKDAYLTADDTLFGFSIGTTKFNLKEISSTDTSKFVIKNTNDKYSLVSQGNGSASLVFTYDNGLQISIKVMAGVSYNGTGEANDPIEVDSAEVLVYVVNILPNYYYIQTKDIDLTGYTMAPISTVEGSIASFTGSYNGQNHKISNMVVSAPDTDTGAGLFGVIEGQKHGVDGNVVPNVYNLTFENCTVTGGDNTGILAGKTDQNDTGSPIISNITVRNSNVTGGHNTAGLIGTVAGETQISDITIENVNVTSEAGAAGGIFGSVTNNSAVIRDVSNKNSVITSANLSDTDVAGGIAAYAVGTINGKSQTAGEGEEAVKTLLPSVEGCTVSAYIASGAIGAVYKLNATDVVDLAINDVQIKDTKVTGSATTKVGSAATASGILSAIQCYADVSVNNCYVDNQTEIFADKFASGVIGRNISNYFTSLSIMDTETYADVMARQGAGTQMAYAGGMISYVSGVNCNIITMNGCVAGGKVTASAYDSSAGGAIGGMYSTDPITSELFVNGVLSASVFAKDGTETGLVNSGTVTYQYKGKFIANFSEGNFVDNADFSTVVFHDVYYSSYPQNFDFFGRYAVDSFQSLTPGSVPFENINTSSNFMVSRNATAAGPWNAVAVTKDLNETNIIYAKFSKSELAYGNGRISTIDPKGFTAGGTCVTVENIGEPVDDPNIGLYYEIALLPTAYGADQLGAAYSCGLATTIPVLCVEIDGNGTEADPFQIGTPQQLYVVSYLTGEYYFTQTADIDLSQTYGSDGINYNSNKGYSPIGTKDAAFSGVYDGNGHKITGLYANRGSQDYVGLFGYVKKNGTITPAIRNLHVELLESDRSTEKANGLVGRQYVGGLIGFAEGALVENCSVTRSTVIGESSVGALIGGSIQSAVKYSFAQSDAYAFGTNGKAGGLIGSVNNGLNVSGLTVSNCFATGNVYGRGASNLEAGNAGGIVGYIENGTDIQIENCLFNGTTNSGYGMYGNANATATIQVKSCIDAGQSTAMAYGAFAPISSAVAGNATRTTFTDAYYDSSLLKVSAKSLADGTVYGTKATTSELITGNAISGLSAENWDYSANHYPVPKTTPSMDDSYSKAYASMAAMPVLSSETEESTDASSSDYGKGLIYPVKFLRNVTSGGANYSVTYASSIFDTTDMVPYPAGYDPNLYGVGANKNTDLLFQDDSTYTSVYRNIFAQDSSGTFMENPTSGACKSNGEVFYNLQMPVVYAKAKINGIDVYREIKIPLSYGSTYCIATQRQLFALGLAENETAVSGSKFSGYYGSGFNYKLITDIVIDENSEILFNPIGMNDPNGYTGQFDGSGHKIVNLKISQTSNLYNTNVGMFARITNEGNILPVDYAFIKNLTLENATVNGKNNVGSLVGSVDASNVTIDGCSAVGGTVTGTGNNVGGLIGKITYSGSKVVNSNASVTVNGKNDAVGGFVGYSVGTIESCYASGNVVAEKLLTTSSGIGGFVGNMAGGSVENSFASGNVELQTFQAITSYTTSYGIGGFAGIIDSSVTKVETCFSGGNVAVGTLEARPDVRPAGEVTATIGVGGFSGINSHEVKNCYSSASVSVNFNKVYNQNEKAVIAIGIGGVCGVALANVQNVYSSGSVTKPDIANSNVDDPNYIYKVGTVYYGIGGAVGSTKENQALNISNCFFDSWTNTDSTMTSVGDRENSEFVTSYNTHELTTMQLDGFDTNIWGFSEGAYPYLLNILNEKVSPMVRTSAILSVIAVEPDQDDISARTGNGITMALTVPTTFSYMDKDTEEIKTYNLHWYTDENSAGVELNGNKAVPVRTKNVSEYMILMVEVVGMEEYGNRSYERLCADMRGTYRQPYLIGTVDDLEHVAMSVAEHKIACQNYTGFYDQWATPLDDFNTPQAGKVYFQFMSDIDVSKKETVRTFNDITGSVYYTDNPDIVDIAYEGMSLAGNGYALQNITADGYYFNTIGSKTTISNMLFENLSLTAKNGSPAALIGTNKGVLNDVYVTGTIQADMENGENMSGLVRINEGLIDGCVVDVTINRAYKNVGAFAYENAAGGQIINSAAAGNISQSTTDSGVSSVSGFVVNNSGEIKDSFSMTNINIKAAEGAEVSRVAGFCTTNNSGAVIDGCYTRASVNFDNKPADTNTIALFASEIKGTEESVKNIYTSGNLGYCSDTQQSIAFGIVPEGVTFQSVYADKALSGSASYKNFKYAVPTNNLIALNSVSDEMANLFTVDADGNKYPQLASVLARENTQIKDEEGNGIILEEGTVVRNYDVLKAYSLVSTATVSTKNSQYIDAMALNSNSNNLNSTVSSGVTWTVSPSGVVNVVALDNSLRTSATAGKTTLTASTALTLARGKEIKPSLQIHVRTGVNNPNFSDGGYGTQASPYLIGNADSLQALIYYGANADLYFRLCRDINMSGYTFEQIPRFAAKLNAEVDSTKYTIYNLDLNNGGLFKLIDQNAVVRNIGLVGVKVTSTDDYTGALAGAVNGATVENCYAVGQVEGVNNVGGLIGMLYNNSTASGLLTSGKVNGVDTVGGVVGVIDSSFVDTLESTAYVSGTSCVAGILGEAINASEVSNMVFAGMSKGSSIAGLNSGSTISNAYYDGQLNISETAIGTADDTAVNSGINAKNTSQICNLDLTGFTKRSGYYIVPACFTSGNAKFLAGAQFATMTLTFRSGSSKGTVSNYASITMQNTLNANAVEAKEVQLPGQGKYLTVTKAAGVIKVSVGTYDASIERTGLNIILSSDITSPIFAGSGERVFRYIEPGMVRTVNISYTLTNASGDDLTGKTVGVLVRNKYDPSGTIVDALNSFTKLSSSVSEVMLDSMSISTTMNGFYVGEHLPEGYKYEVTAVDGNGKALAVSITDGEYGQFVELSSDSNTVKLSIKIVKASIPWGVHVYRDTLNG